MNTKQLRENTPSTPRLLALKTLFLNRRLVLRAYRKRFELRLKKSFLGKRSKGGVICFSTVRNEKFRLPYFLKHYRGLGVQEFYFVDNGSTDGTFEYLSEQPDTAIWASSYGYRDSRFGTDWLNYLLNKYGRNKWVLVVDADELLIYPEWEDMSLPELTKKISKKSQRALAADLIDLYPNAPLNCIQNSSGEEPIKILQWFDGCGYWVEKQKRFNALRLQGGVRARFFFQNQPELAPTLNKIPLVFWRRGYTLVNSTHTLLPAKLNSVWKNNISGALLHTKFLPGASDRAKTERERDQHFQSSQRYRTYYERIEMGPNLWTKDSERFSGWKQLVALGLMKNCSN